MEAKKNRRSVPQPGAPLSYRQRQVLHLAMEGQTTEMIAKFFRVSINAIEAQRHAIIVKLGAKNMVHAAVIALRNGIIEPPKEVVT